MKKYFKAEIKDGKFISNKSYFRQGVSYMPDGKYVMMLLKETDKDVRECQNMYFAQLGQWSTDTGYSRNELHEMVKDELFVELFDQPISTTELTKDQWTMVFLNLQNFLLLKFENR